MNELQAAQQKKQTLLDKKNRVENQKAGEATTASDDSNTENTPNESGVGKPSESSPYPAENQPQNEGQNTEKKLDPELMDRLLKMIEETNRREERIAELRKYILEKEKEEEIASKRSEVENASGKTEMIS